MNILLSTNTFIDSGLKTLKELLEKEKDLDFGLEIFPNWENEAFKKDIEALKPLLKERHLTVHGPYFNVEHSTPKGSESYEYSMKQIDMTLELCGELGIHHLVFHHNNKEINEANKESSIEESTKNLHELNEICKEAGVEILVENAGVKSRNNMLFDEEEFIAMAKSEANDVLIDIGHVHANGWDMENVITSLADKITHFHLHNNDGLHDDHNRIHDGSLDFGEFIKLHQTHTPEADLVLEYNYEIGYETDQIVEDFKYLEEKFKN